MNFGNVTIERLLKILSGYDNTNHMNTVVSGFLLRSTMKYLRSEPKHL